VQHYNFENRTKKKMGLFDETQKTFAIDDDSKAIDAAEQPANEVTSCTLKRAKVLWSGDIHSNLGGRL
jgi:hypothetical protein